MIDENGKSPGRFYLHNPVLQRSLELNFDFSLKEIIVPSLEAVRNGTKMHFEGASVALPIYGFVLVRCLAVRSFKIGE